MRSGISILAKRQIWRVAVIVAVAVVLFINPRSAAAQNGPGAGSINASSSSGLTKIAERLTKGGLPATDDRQAVSGDLNVNDAGNGNGGARTANTKGILDGILGGIAGGGNTVAGAGGDSDSNGDLANSGSVELFVDKNGKNMLASWDGWSEAYEGYGRSPILFDQADMKNSDDQDAAYVRYKTDLKRKYPELSFASKDQEWQKRSMRVVNIGVDKEIMKSTMTIYRANLDLQNSFAEDEFARDNYLNMFKTLRGVANMTLSYLDKTVAAGLATTQAQADATTTNDLLKQISWSSARMANPQLSHLYRDVDEKVEACLFVNTQSASSSWYQWVVDGVNSSGLGGPTAHTRRYYEYEVKKTLDKCEQNKHCGKKPSGIGGLYRFCICCAESENTINRSSVDEKGEMKENRWSLVERVFYGVHAPKVSTSNTEEDKACYVRRVAQSFKELYGDVILSKGHVDYTGTEPSTDKEHLFLRFEYPSLSPAQKIGLIRNGPAALGNSASAHCQGTYSGVWSWMNNFVGSGTTSTTGSGSTLACPIQDIMVTKGICPAIIDLLKKYPNVTDGKDQSLLDLWTQASLGKLITPKDLEDMLNMGGYQNYELPLGDSWKPQGNLYTYLQSFCDASAVSAFKRFHVRMKSLAIDHVTLNKNANEDEKRDFFALVDRVDRYLALAEQDVASSDVAKTMSIQLSNDAARRYEERWGSNVEAARNSTWINQVSSGTKGFGGR